VATTRGQRLAVRLDDGTRVALGPASTLRYAIGSTARRVELSGLAQFRVTHDPARPFTVRAANAVATDLGTTFTVRAFAEESSVVVAVTEGRVSLQARAASLSLAAGQVGIAGRGGVVRSDLAAARLSEWTEGRLSFTDATLGDVARELSRWFDADVRVDDARLAARRVSADYANPTLSVALTAIARATGARVDRMSGTFVLRPASTSGAR
jgi:transmembrane sensor